MANPPAAYACVPAKYCSEKHKKGTQKKGEGRRLDVNSLKVKIIVEYLVYINESTTKDAKRKQENFFGNWSKERKG